MLFFCKYSQKSHLDSKAFQRKRARHKRREKTEVWRKKGQKCADKYEIKRRSKKEEDCR